jgi:uncharacterized membrane protein
MNETTPHTVTARTVDVQRAIGWWTDAWQVFMKKPATWIGMGVLLLVILFVLSLIPVLGNIASLLLLPVFMGGWALAARKAASDENPEVGDLFACFRDRLAPLLVIGAVMLAGGLVIGLVAGALGVGAMMGSAGMGMQGGGAGAMSVAAGGMLALLVALALGAALAIAIWFAPTLVVLDNVPPVDAMKASFTACLKNAVTFVVYGVLYMVAAFLASLPLMLGWVLLGPIVMLTIYVSYRDIFGPSPDSVVTI